MLIILLWLFDVVCAGSFKHMFTTSGLYVTQKPAAWHLSTLNPTSDPSIVKFFYTRTNLKLVDVFVYVLDTGIDKTHPVQELAGKVVESVKFNNGEKECLNHGTAVASVLAGSTCGVAKDVKIMDVAILNCDNEYRMEDLEASLDWILKNHKTPSIVLLPKSQQKDNLDKVKNLLSQIHAKGSIIISGAGDHGKDSCDYFPASLNFVFTVAGSTNKTQLSPTTNYGLCSQIVAPSSSIVSASLETSIGYSVYEGTEYAAASVAGICSIFWYTSITGPLKTGEDVKNTIVNWSANQIITDKWPRNLAKVLDTYI